MRGAVDYHIDKGEKRRPKKELPFHWLVSFSTDFKETRGNEEASKIYFFLLFSFNSIFFETPRGGVISLCFSSLLLVGVEAFREKRLRQDLLQFLLGIHFWQESAR